MVLHEHNIYGQSSCGLVNSWTIQLAKKFDLKFGVHYHSKCDFRQIIHRVSKKNGHAYYVS